LLTFLGPPCIFNRLTARRRGLTVRIGRGLKKCASYESTKIVDICNSLKIMMYLVFHIFRLPQIPIWCRIIQSCIFQSCIFCARRNVARLMQPIAELSTSVFTGIQCVFMFLILAVVCFKVSKLASTFISTRVV